MTTTEHTPGPWRNNGGRIEAGKAYPHVAVVGEINHQTVLDTANARLITAAPDLLAALQVAIPELLQYSNDGHADYGPDDDYSPALRLARAAIAKATGRTD